MEIEDNVIHPTHKDYSAAMRNQGTNSISNDTPTTTIAPDDDHGRNDHNDDVKKDQDPSNAVKENELDEEGLQKSGYDVILFGTGLTQSILASALTRAGQSILHVDGNDFYGEREAVFSLGSFINWTDDIMKRKNENKKGEQKMDEHDKSQYVSVNRAGPLSSIEIHSSTKSNGICFAKGMHVVTPYGQGIIQSLPIAASALDNNKSKEEHQSLIITLNNWIMANGKSPTAYFGYEHDKNVNDENYWNKDEFHSKMTQFYTQNHDVLPLSTFQFQQYILGQKRDYAFDLTPGLLYANGHAVNGLVESKVSEYCEFKSILGLHLFMQQEKSGSSRIIGAASRKNKIQNMTYASTSTTTASTDLKQQFQLSRVPCSKRDVFQTKLLSPVEKRKLMKFLQMAFDYATSASTRTKESTTTNETTNNSSEADAVTSLNERQLQQGRSLYRPQNKSVATTDIEKLQECMNGGMNFDEYLSVEHKLPPRLRNIVIYALAMGYNHDISGDSSSPSSLSYSTKQGMDDLSQHLQSLGRYGSTAFLVPLYGTGELSQAFCRSAAVHGGTYLLRRAISKVFLNDSNNDEEEGVVSGILLNETSCEDDEESKKDKIIPTKHIVLPSDSIEIIKGYGKNKKQRILRKISIVRGKLLFDASIESTEQRHIIVIPPNTIGNKNVIHVIAMDESAQIAPKFNGQEFSSTVLHLTTIIEDDEDIYILDKASESILYNQIELGVSTIEELYHINFSYETKATLQDQRGNVNYQGLHVCNSLQSITVEASFKQASKIFQRICPNLNFLQYSQEMDEKVKESRFGIVDEDEDHDKTALESAMNLMDLNGL
jgi:RAB protein geranylgeranyltransferase component A